MFTTPEQAHVRRGIKHMESHDSLWEHTYMVTNLGQPTPFNGAPAAVYKTRDSQETFLLGVNAKDCDAFPDGQMSGVLLHEAHHIIFRHFSNKLNKFPGQNQKALTIAEEIQVNDTVLHLGAELPDNLYFGKKHIGMDSYGMTLLDIYKEVIKNQVDSKDDPDSSQGSTTPCDCDNRKSGGVSYSPTRLSPTDAQEIEEAYNSKNSDSMKSGTDPSNGAGAGTDADSVNSVRWAKEHNTSATWVNLLANISPQFSDSLRRNGSRVTKDWSRSAPHLQAYRHNGAVVVPRRRANIGSGTKSDVPAIKLAVFVDQSGSIGAKEKVAAATIAASAPTDTFDIDLYVFAGRVAPMKGNGRVDANIGFGTDWAPIANTVNSSKYDAVIIMTDGEMMGRNRLKTKDVFYVDLAENDSSPFALRGNIPIHPVIRMSDFTSQMKGKRR